MLLLHVGYNLVETSYRKSVRCVFKEMLEVDVVCLDFSKAFDTIFHSILLKKLVIIAWMGALFFR